MVPGAGLELGEAETEKASLFPAERLAMDGEAGHCFMDEPELKRWCPEPDSNRHDRYQPRDFKSLASTYSATRACWVNKNEYMGRRLD